MNMNEPRHSPADLATPDLDRDLVVPPTSTDNNDNGPPHLPFELIEAILIHVPLLHPLSSFRYYGSYDRRSIHGQCTSALQVVSLPRLFFMVCTPRLLNGLELVLSKPDLFGLDFIRHLYRIHYWSANVSIFAQVFRHNRVDVLDWWVNEGGLRVPRRGEYEDNWRELPVRIAFRWNAYDVLIWLAKERELDHLCNFALTDVDLGDLVLTGGQKGAQAVLLWIKAEFDVDDDCGHLLDAACEMGNMCILKACGRGDWLRFADSNDMSAAAIRGRGPVIPVLEWMLKKRQEMPFVAEQASEHGKVDVLEWWKDNKTRIDALVPDKSVPKIASLLDNEEDELDPEYLEIETLWLSQLKEQQGFCIDLARKNGHQHVIDWWMQNLDHLPFPNATKLLHDASKNGDVDLLKIWDQRRKPCDGIYDWTTILVEATHGGHLNVLEWWVQNRGIRLMYNVGKLIREAITCDQWETMVPWWISHMAVRLHIGECSSLIEQCDNVVVLERWYRLGCILPCDIETAVRFAARRGRAVVLDWWGNSGISLDSVIGGGDHALVDELSASGIIASLHCIHGYCIDRGIEFAYSEKALDGVVWEIEFPVGNSWQFAVVKWWCESGLELKYTEAAFENAIYSLSFEEIRWWLKQRLPLPMPQNVTREFIESADASFWFTGGPRLVHDRWVRAELGFEDD